MNLNAAEQVFERTDGGCSSLIWIAHPQRALIFMLHDYERWRGWPDLWSGQPVEAMDVPAGFIDTERGFGYLVRKANLTPLIGYALRGEQPYQAQVEELEGGWRLMDSYGRRLELKVMPSHWSVLEFPGDG